MLTNDPKFQDPNHDVVRRNIKRELPCVLDDAEALRISRARTQRESERDTLLIELADETKRRKDQIRALEDEIAKMGREIRLGKQDRTVSCNEVFRRAEDGTGWIHTVRLDTGEFFERRPASAHETQRYLPGTDPAEGGTVIDKAHARQRSAESDTPAADGESSVPEGAEASAGDDVPDITEGEDSGDATDAGEEQEQREGGKKRRKKS